VHVVEIVEMDDEELYVSDYVLEEASAARYQMLPKKPKLRIRKNLQTEKNEWVKDSERKWSEWKINLHPLITIDTDSIFREVLNKNIFRMIPVLL
jgi:uncharacterized protein YvpB